MRSTLIQLPRSYKRLILALNDFCLTEISLLLAFTFRLGWWPTAILDIYWPAFVVAPICVMGWLYKLELYSSVTRHAGGEVLEVIARGMSFGVLLTLLIFFLYPIVPPLPRSVLLMFWVLGICVLYLSRLTAGRWLHGTPLSSLMLEFARGKRGKKHRRKPVAVYGAGSAGRQLATALTHGNRYTAVAFIDDNAALHGQILMGLRVYSAEDIGPLSEMFPDLEVYLAIPSASRQRRRQIINFLEPLDVHVQSVPSMDELAQGIVRVEDIREVDVADILGREAVPADYSLLSHSLAGKSILVTGAGGSIGSELCRQILRYKPAVLVMLDHCEFSLYSHYSDMQELHRRSQSDTQLIPIMASVTDGPRLLQLFDAYDTHLVFHCAAYKHVHLVEQNAYQGFVNNVVGTLELARAAISKSVEKVLLVSSDKAVRPTSIMGATKRVAELAFQALDAQNGADFSPLSGLMTQGSIGEADNKTQFTMVRFGNVLDSSGSVIPKFRKQIRQGGPVTVTHPEVTRYFMTIPEAAELVLQANGLSEGGDLFLLDMGEPVRIDDLARKMIHLSGLSHKSKSNPEGDIEITYTGIMPGEKLFEELLLGENTHPTRHPKISRASESWLVWDEYCKLIVSLQEAFLKGDVGDVTRLLARPEIGYQCIGGSSKDD